MSNSMPRILIVEDDGLIALSMEVMVEDLGYWVIGPMHTLSDGLDHARHDELDFALLDFDLGHGVDAIPIAEALGRRGIPYAFTSGTEPAKILASLPKAAIIGKPIREKDVERVLATI